MKWKEYELEILRSCESLKEACEKLPHRTVASIRCKRSNLGISWQTWSDREIDILRKYYVEEGWRVKRRLRGRSWPAIRTKVSELREKGIKI